VVKSSFKQISLSKSKMGAPGWMRRIWEKVKKVGKRIGAGIRTAYNKAIKPLYNKVVKPLMPMIKPALVGAASAYAGPLAGAAAGAGLNIGESLLDGRKSDAIQYAKEGAAVLAPEALKAVSRKVKGEQGFGFKP
jgi:hypothetical protein